jgi:uncharacterized membrane protein YdcZ (DUF606 family)
MNEMYSRLKLTHRKVGVIFLVLAGIFAYHSIYIPVHAILEHENSSQFKYFEVIFCIGAALYGILLLILGEKHIEIFGHIMQPNFKAKMLGVLLLVPGYFLAEELNTFIKDHGYVITEEK